MSERRTRDRHGALPGLLQGGSLAAGPWAGLTWQCLVDCLGGPLLPGAAACPPLLPHGCPSSGPHWPLWWLLWDSLKATADLPPARRGKNRCFHRGHLRSLNFLPLEPLPVLAQ